MRLYLSSFRLGNKPETLLRLLGGGTKAAAITNADDYKTGWDRTQSFERERGDLAGLGLEATELDLRDYFGKAKELRAYLENVDLIWIRGGNPFILRRAMRASGADTAILDLLAADAVVYGGYSAGACIMTPSLRGIENVDDPNDVPDHYDPEIIWEALDVLPYHILPHYKSDHPESPFIDRSVEYMIANHLPFITLRDGEALVREGSEEFVVG